jgi:O-acetylhomoserine (thiol)-lyase
LYGGTYNLFHYTLPKMGIDVSFVDDPDDLEQWRAAARPNTKAFYGEVLANPRNNVLDIEGVSKVAHEIGVPLIVDNTVPTPYLIRPLEWGADIVVHSLTKFMGGHGTSVAGAIVDGGTFDYAASGRFPNFTEPDPSYHGLAYFPALGHGAFILKARVQMLRDMGLAISPFNAFLILQGIETLALRMDRTCDNALAVARFLQSHPRVNWVNYAGLPDSPSRPLAERYMGGRASGILTFGVAGGREAGARVQDAFKLFTRLVNIGDAKSLACHPASTTHRQLSPEELASAGVSEDMIRLSIGIEHIDDLIEDLDQALSSAGGDREKGTVPFSAWDNARMPAGVH